MKVHPEELMLARAYERSRVFEELSPDQMHLIMERGRRLFKWYKAHPATHNFINGCVLLFVLVADGWVLLGLPRLFLAANGQNEPGWILLTSMLTGSAHSWLIYSLGVFSLHEGAAHNAVFSGTGAFAKAGQFLSRNISRLAGTDPESYSACHMTHHAKFGTEEDSEFLNFVLPRRYWMTFWPLAAFINVTDFVSHRPLTYTRSRVLSAAVGALYNGAYACLLYRSFGLAFTLLTMLVFVPHVGFYMDRLRQFTEHNLMPLENLNGARSFGMGFWGLLLGGGPWGQPCHLVHHLVASIPWYQQMVLHRYMKTLLTERQREQFLLTPVIGFPKLLWRIRHEADAFARQQLQLSRDASSAVQIKGE
jgi:hypothetical protein